MSKNMENYCLQDSGVVHPALKAYVGYCLYKAAMKHRSKMNVALSKHKLIVPQLGILFLLHSEGPLSQVELGDTMSIDKATMVKLIDGLEQRKWIVREFNASDRRVKKVTLTTGGNKILKELLELREGVERDFLSVLTKEEEKQLRAIIPKLL